MGKSHALQPLQCWKSPAGRVLRIVNVVHVLQGVLNPSLLAISLGKFSAIHDCSADKPQTKKWGGGGW